MKKTIKTILTLSLTSSILLSGASAAAPLNVFAAEEAQAIPILQPIDIQAGEAPAAVATPVTATAKEVNNEDENLKAALKIPVLSGLKDTEYQAKVNALIESTAMKDLESWKQRAKENNDAAKAGGFPVRQGEMMVVYELKSGGTGWPPDIVSLRVTTYGFAGGAHGETRTDYYNIMNTKQARAAQLSDLFGPDYKTIVDKAVREGIAAKPENFFKDTFKGIDDTQGFYIENGEAVIEFPQYAIAPYSSGQPAFRIPIPGNESAQPQSWTLNIAGEAIPADQGKVIVSQDKTIMIPLRLLADKLGYELTWNAADSSAELKKGAQWTKVTLGKDSYFFAKEAPFQLGAAPVIADEKMYVPLAFADKVLKASVTKTLAGVIQISQQP